MNAFSALYRREMRSYFVSPVAYIILAVFFILSGFFFFQIVSFTGQANLSGLFGNIAVILLFTTPFITMRLVAEEKRSGTMELLLTSPVRPLEIILAKFMAAWSLIGIALAGTFVYVVLLLLHSPMEFGPLFTGYLGLVFLSGALVALGLLASALAESQIAAGIIGFGLSFLLMLLNWVGQAGKDVLHVVLRELSLVHHYGDFIEGIFDAKHIVFYLFWIVLCLSFAVKSIEARLMK